MLVTQVPGSGDEGWNAGNRIPGQSCTKNIFLNQVVGTDDDYWNVGKNLIVSLPAFLSPGMAKKRGDYSPNVSHSVFVDPTKYGSRKIEILP